MFEIAKRFPDKTAGLSPSEMASWEDGYETAKREDDADYQGDREAFRRHIKETGEEEGTTYLF